MNDLFSLLLKYGVELFMLFQLFLMILMMQSIEKDLNILGQELKSTNESLAKLTVSLMNSLNTVQKLVNEHRHFQNRNKNK